MRVPASAEYVSLIRLTLSGVFSRAGATYEKRQKVLNELNLHTLPMLARAFR
jgi:anti-sigma regulatory factor (Ser/Thr protein kinase)